MTFKTDREAFPGFFGSSGKTEVHEHRAPTDDSIRLAEEMRAKVEAKLLQVAELRSNTFDCTWHVFHEPCAARDRVIVRFALNENRYEVELQIESAISQSDLATKIRDAIARKVANIITTEVLMCAEVRRAIS